MNLESDDFNLENVRGTPWGNNFFVYFELLMEQKYPELSQKYTDSIVGPFYLASIKIQGEENFQDFVEKTPKLLEKIFEELKKIRELDYADLQWQEKRNLIWDKLDPLLIEASFEMTKYGLDVEEFKK